MSIEAPQRLAPAQFTPQDSTEYRASATLCVDLGPGVREIDEALKEKAISGGVGREALGDLVEEIGIKNSGVYDPRAIKGSRDKIARKRGEGAGYDTASKEIEGLLRRRHSLMYQGLGEEGSGFVQPEEAAKIKTRYHKELTAIFDIGENVTLEDAARERRVYSQIDHESKRGGVIIKTAARVV